MMKVIWKAEKRSLTFLKLPIFRLRRRGIPHLVPVNEEQHKCDNPLELKLLEALSHQNYYVTPKVKCGKVVINLALIPFRIAIVEKNPKLMPRYEKTLKKKGWNIVYYSEEELKKDFYEVIRRINKLAHAGNNVIEQPN